MNPFLLLLGLMLIACFATPARGEAVPDIASVDPHEAQMAGFDLNETEAADLEARLEANPGDHVARATLMAYQRRRTYADGGSRAAAARAHELAEWFVREHPGAPPTGFLQPAPQVDPAGVTRLIELWEPHLQPDKPPLPVLLNAADFYLQLDRERARALLERAIEAYPGDAEARRKLAFSWTLASSHGPEAERAAAAGQALRHLLAAEAIAGDGDGVHDADVAAMAWLAGEAETAERYARRMVENPGRGWNEGNRVYDGNRILGHLALDAGDHEAAVGFLDAAGASEGSPQLNSFGPELTLAQALLDADETDAVLRHLEAVGRFWAMDDGKLQAWAEAIRAGQKPTLSRFSGS